MKKIAWQSFEVLFFPVVLFTGVFIMINLIEIGQWVEQGYFIIPMTILSLVYLFEQLHPMRKEWNIKQGDTSTDLWSFGCVALLIEPLLTAIGPAIALTLLILLGVESHFELISASIPFWGQAILAWLLIEFGKYCFHRLSHENAFFWRFHSSHHSVNRMYLLNGFRLHPLYHVATYMITILPCLLIGFSHDALILHTVVLATCGAFQHANIKLRFGPLNYIFHTNQLHQWHHSIDLSQGNKNYGACLIIYDLLFGSYYLPKSGHPVEMGIKEQAVYPMNNYWKQLWAPFLWQRWIKDKQSTINAESR